MECGEFWDRFGGDFQNEETIFQGSVHTDLFKRLDAAQK